jgi:hypothetical protein
MFVFLLFRDLRHCAFCWPVVLNKSVRRVACSIVAIILLSIYLRVVVPNNWFLFCSLESEDQRYICHIQSVALNRNYVTHSTKSTNAPVNIVHVGHLLIN